jgi:hypothetical protein
MANAKDHTKNASDDGVVNENIDRKHTIGMENFFRMRKDLKLHHKLMFVALAFVGLNFCWYGVWMAITRTPFISNPLIAVIIGVILMKLTGKINDLA